MIFGVGTDIFLMSRIAKQSVTDGDPFLMRAFTENERSMAKNHIDSQVYYSNTKARRRIISSEITRSGLIFVRRTGFHGLTLL